MSVQFITGECIEKMSAMEPNSVDLVFASPPYCDARTYGIGAQRDCLAWVEWMLDVTEAAARVCKGPVLWVMAGVTRKRNYWPACEGLIYEWWKRGGTHELYRPCIFHRVGIPGSGGNDWFRSDWEYVACFKKPGALAWSDNTACGHVPKWAPGGEMSNRTIDGDRVNQCVRDQWGGTGNATGAEGRNADGSRKTRERKQITRRTANGRRAGDKSHTKTLADGTMENQEYVVPVFANPGNVFKVNVGGGVMGSKICHENEAPFPEKLAEIFIRSLCPPGGTVLDCFSGSGTTAAVAKRFVRSAIGIDLRESQSELGRRRIATVQEELFI